MLKNIRGFYCLNLVSLSMEPKASPILGLRPFIRAFFKKFPQHIQYKTERPKDFTDLIIEFHKDLRQAVIDNRYGVDLPLKLGNIKIVSYKKNREYLNGGEYKKNKIVTSFSNNHTDGLSCKIVYVNSGNKYKFKDKMMWAFKPNKFFKKQVSIAFSKNYQKYIFSPNRGQIRAKNNHFKWKDINDKNIDKFLLDYNEFEIN